MNRSWLLLVLALFSVYDKTSCIPHLPIWNQTHLGKLEEHAIQMASCDRIWVLGDDFKGEQVYVNGIPSNEKRKVFYGYLFLFSNPFVTKKNTTFDVALSKEPKAKKIKVEKFKWSDIPLKTILPEFNKKSGNSHGLKSGNIVLLTESKVRIPNLHYDGQGPGAYFWVGKGKTPDENGYAIPNEKNSSDVLSAYKGETIELTLPPNTTFYNIDYLGIWCEKFPSYFGYVSIPKDMVLPLHMFDSVIGESSKGCTRDTTARSHHASGGHSGNHVGKSSPDVLYVASILLIFSLLQ